MISTRVGEPIRLNHHLGDGETGRYVRAILKRSDGTEITGSPTNLTDVGDGTYLSNAVTMPNEPIVIAVYKTFKDAAYSEIDDDYDDSLDVFVREREFEEIIRRDSFVAQFKPIGEIEAKIVKREFKAQIVDDWFRAEMSDETIRGEFQENKIEGEVNYD